MADLRIGSTDVADVRIGSTEIASVFKGTDLVWQRAPDKPLAPTNLVATARSDAPSTAVVITTKRFSTPTTIGQVTWSDANLNGLTPKGVMFIANHADTDGVNEANVAASINYTDGTRFGGASWSSADAVGTSSSYRVDHTDRAVGLLSGNTVQVSVDFVSFQADGVTLDFTSVDTDAQLWTVIFFAGDDVSCYVDGQQIPHNTTVDMTAPGFQPDLVFINTITDNAFNSIKNQNIQSFGVASSTAQRSWAMQVRDAQSTTTTNSVFSETYIGRPVFPESIVTDFSADNFDAQGFDLSNLNDAYNAARNVSYFAVGFNGSAQVSVSTIDSPTAPGAVARTLLGFEPQFVMLGTTNSTTVDIANTTNTVSVGVSCITVAAQFSNSWSDEDAITTTNSKSRASAKAVHMNNIDATVMHEATLTSMDTDGYTLNYTVADATPRKWFEVAISKPA